MTMPPIPSPAQGCQWLSFNTAGPRTAGEGTVLDVLVQPSETRRRAETDVQAPEDLAMSGHPLVQSALRNSYFASLGLP
jgi:hypothetical protein